MAGQVKVVEKPLFISFFALQDIESQNFFSQDIGGTPHIHISTLLLSMYPHFVEMLWITPFFGHILSTNGPFMPFLSPSCNSGLFIKNNVIHNLINIYL